jgi:cytoskeleton protein RodZ
MEAVDDLSDAITAKSEPEGVGAFLRARRLALGLSHADVASAVKLSARRIQALEDERWSELPDGPYLRGFLRNVARALDLDATQLTERVDKSLIQSRNPESILVPQGAARAMLPRRSGPVDDRHGGRTLIFSAFVFAVIAAVIAWSGTESFDRTVTTGRSFLQSGPSKPPSPVAIVPATPSTEPAEVPKEVDAAPVLPAPTGTANPEVATPVPSASLALLFHFNEESWVEVRSADGRVLLKALNPAGSDQQVDGEAPFSLIVGNAKGVALRFRGQPVDLGPYIRDQVARLTLP